MRGRADLQLHVSERLALAKRAVREDDLAMAWAMLEDAHVLSQPMALPHVRVHVAMLALGTRTGDLRETAGQLMRMIVAAPGTWLGRYPVGNTGRARVRASESMPIRNDLQRILDGPLEPSP